MKKIAITGLNGVIGQILAEELKEDFLIYDLYHSKKYIGKRKIAKHLKFELLDKNKIIKILDKINPNVIIHMAAITHIDKCEKDKKNGKNGIVWKTNVEGTSMIAEYSARRNIQMIFLSTECVFDGQEEFYKENSKKNPINWYGFTKDEAEKSILAAKAKSAILRSVVAYHKNDKGKTIYGKILHALNSKKDSSAVFDQMFTPTFTYDIAKAINIIIEHEMVGIFHVAPDKNISPYDLARVIAKKNNISQKLIKKKTLLKYYGREGALLRLRNASLNGEKTNKILKFTPLTPEEAL